MPFHLHFTTVEVLWTVTFAALLVLLVVLLGRDRARLYPFFTLSTAVIALRLLVSRMLFGRLSPVALSVIFYALAILAALASLLVVVEMARRAFAGASRRAWINTTLVVLVLTAAVLWFWGPWPAWKTLTGGGALSVLRFMELAGQRGDMLASLLAIELGILIALFGRRFHAPWRSHTQQIVLGLSTAAMAQLAIRAIWQLIALKTVVHSRADYDRVMGIQDKLFNANNVTFICVVLWWIYCLWNDEPGTAPALAASDPEHVDPVAIWDEEGGKSNEA